MRQRNTGEGNEGENTRSRAGLTKVTQCRCGGKADCGGAQGHWRETEQKAPQKHRKHMEHIK